MSLLQNGTTGTSADDFSQSIAERRHRRNIQLLIRYRDELPQALSPLPPTLEPLPVVGGPPAAVSPPPVMSRMMTMMINNQTTM